MKLDAKHTYDVDAVEVSTSTNMHTSLDALRQSNEHTGDEKVVIVYCSCLCYVLNLE